jgi:uncharacterized DUF497 family protein
MQFEWSDSKDAKNLQDRGIGFQDGAAIFAGRTLRWEDDRRAYGETRYRAVGMVNDVILHVVYTERGDALRIISVRRANRKERAAWQSFA